ncbi:MAG: PrsW family glutamic-type intramembrane protease [Candidatus Paceibacterota bacterium]|jgi:RsiW-degrading membrane proteinase PrsW (M82 family)
MAPVIGNPQILILAFALGIIPSLLWLWFWLKEQEDPEPMGLLTATFIMGMIAVIFVLPVQKFIQSSVSSANVDLVLWAGTEEIFKYLAVLVVLYKTNYADRPIDWPIYLITAALGFATLENALFLIKPLSTLNETTSLLTVASLGQLRFLGSTLLHTISSGTVGIAIGISFYLEGWKKKWYLFAGFGVAIALHTVFNFFIIRNNGNDFLKVFAFLWVITIIIMLLFEKVRRMNEQLLIN